MGTKQIKNLPRFKRYNWYILHQSQGFWLFNHSFAWDHLDEFICFLIPSSVKYYLNADLLKTDTRIPGNISFTWICVFNLVLFILCLILSEVKIWPLQVFRKILWIENRFHPSVTSSSFWLFKEWQIQSFWKSRTEN